MRVELIILKYLEKLNYITNPVDECLANWQGTHRSQGSFKVPTVFFTLEGYQRHLQRLAV